MDKKLGLGCMRLPLTNPDDVSSINIGELSRMVDLLIENGFTYFDTAYTYHDGHCEAALRKALVERYPRNAYSLTDKLPTLLLESEEQQERIFAEQLERCGVEYFDRYLVHCATAAFYEKAERFRSFEFAIRKKREGLTRMIGFSYHDSPELLDAILTRYPEVDFVQLQISYIDWERTPIQAHRCYDIARRHGKPVVVMCPLKGGMLADVPSAVERLFKAYAPDAAPASWAIRYAASPEGVTTVLSGMSSVAQVKEAIAYMHDFKPLNDEERAIVDEATDIICRTTPIQCTSCGYCVPACPANIPIFEYLHLYNVRIETGISGSGDTERAYRSFAEENYGKASDCIGCKQCEGSCPQHLSIASWIAKVADMFESAECGRKAAQV